MFKQVHCFHVLVLIFYDKFMVIFLCLSNFDIFLKVDGPWLVLTFEPGTICIKCIALKWQSTKPMDPESNSMAKNFSFGR